MPTNSMSSVPGFMRERSFVLERLLVILGMGDGHFARHMIPVDRLEALDDLQLFPVEVHRGIQAGHCVKSPGFDDHRVAFQVAAGRS